MLIWASSIANGIRNARQSLHQALSRANALNKWFCSLTSLICAQRVAGRAKSQQSNLTRFSISFHPCSSKEKSALQSDFSMSVAFCTALCLLLRAIHKSPRKWLECLAPTYLIKFVSCIFHCLCQRLDSNALNGKMVSWWFGNMSAEFLMIWCCLWFISRLSWCRAAMRQSFSKEGKCKSGWPVVFDCARMTSLRSHKLFALYKLNTYCNLYSTRFVWSMVTQDYFQVGSWAWFSI